MSLVSKNHYKHLGMDIYLADMSGRWAYAIKYGYRNVCASGFNFSTSRSALIAACMYVEAEWA